MFKYTKEQIEKKLKKKKNKKWIISWLNCGPWCYTKEAWDLLVDLAKNEGVSDDEITKILKKAEYAGSWKSFPEQMFMVVIVCALCLAGGFYIKSTVLLATSSILLIVVGIIYIEKRGF